LIWVWIPSDQHTLPGWLCRPEYPFHTTGSDAHNPSRIRRVNRCTQQNFHRRAHQFIRRPVHRRALHLQSCMVSRCHGSSRIRASRSCWLVSHWKAMNGARVYCRNGGITRSNLRPSVGPIFSSRPHLRRRCCDGSRRRDTVALRPRRTLLNDRNPLRSITHNFGMHRSRRDVRPGTGQVPPDATAPPKRRRVVLHPLCTSAVFDSAVEAPIRAGGNDRFFRVFPCLGGYAGA